MKKLVAVLLAVPMLVWGGFRVAYSIIFEQNCGGYLKRAADANTVSAASKELGIAIAYIEANKLTDGYTSVIYKTPNEDVGFWYNNIKSAKREIDLLPANTTPLEKTNVLMKLRETILDQGEKGTAITVPAGISVYPHNTGWFLFGVVSLSFFIASCIIVTVELLEF